MAKLKNYNGRYCESEYESAFIAFLQSVGWTYLPGNKIKRCYRDVLIADDFRAFITKANTDLLEEEIEQIYDTVRLVGAESDFATLHKVYKWMVDGIQFTPQSGLPIQVTLIDFETPENNIFHVVNQLTVDYINNGQRENRRPDVLLYVNGMPLCIIELKNPADSHSTIYDAWEQITIRYWRDIPHLLHYCPLACMVSKPYAKVLKEAFPHATFVGFTGTPIAETYQTFGDEIDRYTMDQAVADGLTVSIKYHPRIAKVLLDTKKVKEIEAYYKTCADDGATEEDIEASKKAMSSMEIILGEPSRLERLAVDIHDHYVSACDKEPDRIQKAMIVCSNRKIAYELLRKFRDKYPEWFEEKKIPDGIEATKEELDELKPMPFMAMVASVGSNDEKEMYNYLGGVKNDRRSKELDAAFKQEKSNFRIVIVVDMWITGFDVPSLTYLYNDKPLKKHLLIQTISRVNRVYPGKKFGMVIDYIGIRDNMREAMKIYGGDTSVAPTEDDVEQATQVFREELEILKTMFTGYDLKPFLNPNGDPVERYCLLAKAAEYVFSSTEELNSEGKNGTQKVSFKTYFLKTVRRMRLGYDIAQPSGDLSDSESALAQCFMAIAGFVRKMSGTTELDTDSMNRAVSKMVDEALRYNQVESVLDAGEEEDIFSPEYFEKLSDVKMPATKLELLIKMIRKQIKEYSKINKIVAKTYQEMLEETIAIYHERRKHISAEEAGATQEQASEDIIKNATEQALQILRQMNESRESFRKIGLTFEEKAFYDILVSLRDQYNFEYGEDKEIGGMIVNDKCKILAKKVKEIIDTKSSFSDWLNNQNVRNQLKLDIKICLVKNGYPPQYSPEVFTKVMEQVENFEENSDMPMATTYTFPQSRTVSMVAEDIIPYGNKSEN